MKLVVEKTQLKGKVAIPASKSHTIRAIAIASLGQGKSVIRNPLISSDTLSAVACYQALGAGIDTSHPKCWEVSGLGGNVKTLTETIDVGNSGTTMRIAMGSASLLEKGQTVTLTGDEQIQSRPIEPLLSSLEQLGAKAKSVNDNGKAPVQMGGRLTGGKTIIECITSQYLSSLLLAVPLAENDSEINVTLLNEPDYVQMTLDWLDKQGIKYENDRMRHFAVKGRQCYKSFDAVIPADFSSATFFLCAGAILDTDIILTGLDFTDSQPDKAVADYLKAMGADISSTDEGVRIRTSQLKGIEIDMNKTPDALPAMAVTASFAEGTTKLVNVAQARNKETDRIKCMAEELKKMNVDAEERPDGLIIHQSNPTAGSFEGRADHRIVMAMAVGAMAVEGKSTITTAEAMNVTFPTFVELMQKLGANINTVE